MRLRRPVLIQTICEKIGIRKRKSPGSQTFSKRELIQLHSWVHTMDSLKRRHEEEQQQGEHKCLK